jgi:hypothetical protein
MSHKKSNPEGLEVADRDLVYIGLALGFQGGIVGE